MASKSDRTYLESHEWHKVEGDLVVIGISEHAVEELADFSEAGACGTAAVISPIGKIVDADNKIDYSYGKEAGEVSLKLYETLRGIQYGTVEDKHNWNTIIDL